MFNLYNLLGNPYSRFHVYMNALNLALNGKATEHIVPSFRKIDSFLKEWGIGISDQRDLFLTISNVLKENKRYDGKGFSYPKLKLFIFVFLGWETFLWFQVITKYRPNKKDSYCLCMSLLTFFLLNNFSSGKESFKFLTKYLATFSGEDAHIMSEAKEEAVRTIVEFAKAPDMFQVSSYGTK